MAWKQDFAVVTDKDPKDDNVKKELMDIAKRQKLQDSNAKKTFAKMFS